MLSNEDLLKISELMDVKLNMQTKLMERKFDSLEGKIDVLDSRVGSLEEKVVSLDNRVGSLEEKVVSLDNRVGSLEEKVVSLDNRVGGLEEKVVSLDNRVVSLESDVGSLHEKVDDLNVRSRKMELIMENDIKPRLSNIESCYVDTYDRYASGIIEMDSIRTDVNILKDITMEHNKLLKNVR